MRLFGPKNRHGFVIASTRSRCLFLFSPATSALHTFLLRSFPPAPCAVRDTLFQPHSLPTDSPATMHATFSAAHNPSSSPPRNTTITPLRQSSSQTCRPSTSSLPRSHKRVKSTRQSLGSRAKREASIPMVCFVLLGRPH